MECQKRKMSSLQAKMETKMDELKRKDEFIQSVIINKAGKEASSSELEYITKEVSRFFSANYSEKLFSAQEEITELKAKLKSFEETH